VIDEALAHVAKVESVSESKALEQICSEFLLTVTDLKSPKHGKN
jgi:hypothetical protein